MSATPSLTPVRMSYAAAFVAGVTYGMYVVLAGICVHFLIRRRKDMKVTLGFTILMFVVTTIYFVSASKWSEIEFVESTVNPGVFATLLSSPLAVCKDTAYTVNIWLADSLILYRLYKIWKRNALIMIFPVLMYLGSIATGIGLLISTARPGSHFGQANIQNLGIATWTLTVALNVFCTVLIAIRLWTYKSRHSAIGHVPTEYVGAGAIFLESGALYSCVGLIYIGLFAKGLTLQYPFTALWSSVTSIAPNLIILRIALGKDVTEMDQTDLPGTTIGGETAWEDGKNSTKSGESIGMNNLTV